MDHDGRAGGGGVGAFEMRAQILVAAWVQIAFEMLKSENQRVAPAGPVTDRDSRVCHQAPANTAGFSSPAPGFDVGFEIRDEIHQCAGGAATGWGVHDLSWL